MKPKPKTIVQKHLKNFQTLQRVFADGNSCLMECTRKETGEKLAVICAVTYDGKEYQMTPFATFFNGNPYEILEPPTP